MTRSPRIHIEAPSSSSTSTGTRGGCGSGEASWSDLTAFGGEFELVAGRRRAHAMANRRPANPKAVHAKSVTQHGVPLRPRGFCLVPALRMRLSGYRVSHFNDSTGGGRE